MTAANAWDDGDLAEMHAVAMAAEPSCLSEASLAQSRIVDLIEAVQTHRRRDELVVAALQAVVESGCATGSGTTLARKILEIYEGVPA